MAFRSNDPSFAGESLTIAPAFSSAATLSEAAPIPRRRHHVSHPLTTNKRNKHPPLPPLMIAPAWPIRRPGGAVRPAIKATTGLGTGRVLLYFSKNSAASSSLEPPISPMRTMPCVSGSSRKTLSASVCVVPGKGSPPIPITSDCPRPTEVVCATASYVRVPERETIPTWGVSSVW